MLVSIHGELLFPDSNSRLDICFYNLSFKNLKLPTLFCNLSHYDGLKVIRQLKKKSEGYR
jgi:hypothetical protein